MNIKELLAVTSNYFAEHNIAEPRLDAEVLLAGLLDMERIQLYVNYDLPLEEEELESFRQIVYRRARGVPVAYLTGHKEFMSLDFKVDQGVLIPRPETELLVEEVIAFCRERGLTDPHIVDVGTGSGAIAISLAHYLAEARVLGVDVSAEAVRVTRENIERHDLAARVSVTRGDLLSPLLEIGKQNIDVIASNPPYISDREMEELSVEVRQEPRLALSGGSDGLDFYQRIIGQADRVLRPQGLLALEIGSQQADDVRGMFSPDRWQEIEIRQDYAGLDRIVLAVREDNNR